MLSYACEAPSNIALIKYWGKSDPERQWPANSSLSMTLKGLKSITSAKIRPYGGEGEKHQFFFKDDLQPRDSDFGGKIFRYIDWLEQETGSGEALTLHSTNTFPAGCGIASSASGFAALTIACMMAWTRCRSLVELEDRGYHLDRLAQLARMGSGSACRSIHGGFVLWDRGESPNSQSCSRVYDSQHWPLTDIVILVSDSPKAVSSSEGHLSAASSSLFEPRVAIIKERLDRIKKAIADKDFDALGAILEIDALDMHAVMMTSHPPIEYLPEATTKILSWVRSEREKGLLPAYFTLDAGANVHLICESHCRDSIVQHLKEDTQLSDFRLLIDEVGSGVNAYANG